MNASFMTPVSEAVVVGVTSHGADVRVVAPVDLREKVLAGLRRAVEQYADGAAKS